MPKMKVRAQRETGCARRVCLQQIIEDRKRRSIIGDSSPSLLATLPTTHNFPVRKGSSRSMRILQEQSKTFARSPHAQSSRTVLHGWRRSAKAENFRGIVRLRRGLLPSFCLRTQIQNEKIICCHAAHALERSWEPAEVWEPEKFRLISA